MIVCLTHSLQPLWGRVCFPQQSSWQQPPTPALSTEGVLGEHVIAVRIRVALPQRLGHLFPWGPKPDKARTLFLSTDDRGGVCWLTCTCIRESGRVRGAWKPSPPLETFSRQLQSQGKTCCRAIDLWHPRHLCACVWRILRKPVDRAQHSCAVTFFH